MFLSVAHIGFSFYVTPWHAADFEPAGSYGIGVTDSTMLGWYFVEGLAAGVLGHTVYLLFHGWWWFWYGRHAVDG